MEKQELPDLFHRYIEGSLLPEEIRQLQQCIEDEANLGILDQLLEASFADPGLAVTGDYAVEDLYREFLERIRWEKTPVVAFRKRRFYARTAVAATILLAIGVGVLEYVNHGGNASKSESPIPYLARDVAPPANTKAVLTLASGQKVILDSVANGSLAVQGQVKIVKVNNGQIAYQRVSDRYRSPTPQYNTLTVPRGSQIVALTLSDGTKAWLNSASSITYPTAFAGKERRVEITGEVYFEVAKVAGQKFLVSGGGITTEVLGTHFNVNVYNDEADNRVTLLEGSIKVSKGSGQTILSPGQQAKIDPGGIAVVKNVDTEEVMAWKNGYFSFHEADIQTVMRQLARWYNIDVEFEGVNTQSFSGQIGRNLSFGEVLEGLRLTKVNFRVESGNKVIIKP